MLIWANSSKQKIEKKWWKSLFSKCNISIFCIEEMTQINIIYLSLPPVETHKIEQIQIQMDLKVGQQRGWRPWLVLSCWDQMDSWRCFGLRASPCHATGLFLLLFFIEEGGLYFCIILICIYGLLYFYIFVVLLLVSDLSLVNSLPGPTIPFSWPVILNHIILCLT